MPGALKERSSAAILVGMILRRRLAPLLAAGLVLACFGPALAATSKKKAKKKGYDYDKSRYKAYGVLTDPEPRTYRFDENGNPVPPPGSKKTAKKAKKKKSDDAAACDTADACTAGSAGSDAQPPRSEASSPDAAASASASAEGE